MAAMIYVLDSSRPFVVSRNSSSRRPKSARVYGFVALLLGIPSVIAAACRADRWLDDIKPYSLEPSAKPKRTPKSSPSEPRTNPSIAPSPRAEFADDSIHLALGIPTDDSPDDEYLMRKPQYALSYSSVRNVSNWVSWQLEPRWFGDVRRHKGKFIEDRDLPKGFKRANHDDYTGSGFDRGHMVRSEERTDTPEDNRATFLMTNILPQYHDLNAGPWLRLEERCEQLARRENKQLFVMAGGVFPKGKRAPRVIGRDVAVPDNFFKIAIVLEPGQGPDDIDDSTPVLAVIMPNEEGIMSEGWERYRVTVDEIERRTGYEFLSAVPEAVQRAIESRKDN